jgi:hypothetical protein
MTETSSVQSDPQQPIDKTTEPPASFVIADLEQLRKVLADGDSIQRFRLQSRFDIYDRLTKHFEAGTAVYEKLILLDGAIIALSITFLGSLSSRLANAHITSGPHLWMVAVSWLLLIISIYFSYRTIIDRHAAGIRRLAGLSSECHQYIYQRLGVVLVGLSSLIKGEVSQGTERVQISQVFDGLNAALKAESEATVKKVTDFIVEGRKDYHEGLYANLAIGLTTVAVIMLCTFTIISLHMLF